MENAERVWPAFLRYQELQLLREVSLDTTTK